MNCLAAPQYGGGATIVYQGIPEEPYNEYSYDTSLYMTSGGPAGYQHWRFKTPWPNTRIRSHGVWSSQVSNSDANGFVEFHGERHYPANTPIVLQPENNPPARKYLMNNHQWSWQVADVPWVMGVNIDNDRLWILCNVFNCTIQVRFWNGKEIFDARTMTIDGNGYGTLQGLYTDIFRGRSDWWGSNLKGFQISVKGPKGKHYSSWYQLRNTPDNQMNGGVSVGWPHGQSHYVCCALASSWYVADNKIGIRAYHTEPYRGTRITITESSSGQSIGQYGSIGGINGKYQSGNAGLTVAAPWNSAVTYRVSNGSGGGHHTYFHVLNI